MQKWEYIILLVDPDGYVKYVNEQSVRPEPELYQYLNRLGQDGWEVIGAIPKYSYPDSRTSYSNFVCRIILKRPSEQPKNA